jgi:hypothetical protein
VSVFSKLVIMPAITSALRSKLYMGLAGLTLVVLVLTVVGCSMPLWTKSGNTETGLWSTCVYQGEGWISRNCDQFRKASHCNEWYQTARICSVIGICLTAVVLLLAIACAMQSIITKALPLLLVVVAFLAFNMIMWTWISWMFLRRCNDTDGQQFGSSFVLYMIAFSLAVAGFCVALYLLVCDILVPAADYPEMEAPGSYPAYSVPAPATSGTPIYY